MSQSSGLLKTLVSTSVVGRPQKVTVYDVAGASWVGQFIPMGEGTVNALDWINRLGLDELPREPLPEYAEDRSLEMAWIQDHLADLERNYSGEWIAVDGAELVAHASDLPALIRIAANAGHADPFITAIPAGEPTPFYG